MNRGYFKMWRKIVESAVFQNEGLLKTFIWCLAKAAYKETFVTIRTGRGVSEVRITPGSFIFGRHSAAKELHMSPSTVWKRILKLKKLEILNIESNSHYSIITIINWIIYQAETGKGNIESNRQVTGKEHKEEYKEIKEYIYRADSQKILTYLNEKTGKRYRNKKNIESRLKDGATVEDCQRVIDAKLQDAFFIANPKYMNPETLFRPGNFDRYSNEGIPRQEAEQRDSICQRCKKQIVVSSDLTETGCVYCEMEART